MFIFIVVVEKVNYLLIVFTKLFNHNFILNNLCHLRSKITIQIATLLQAKFCLPNMKE